MANTADRVFLNAKVYSIEMDGTETRAEAVAIRDGKFVFVGSDEEARKWIGEKTVVTDCKGGSILPGFGDAHMHFGISVRRFGVVDLNELAARFSLTTPDEVIAMIQQRVKEFAEEHPNDSVIHGSGWDRFWFTGKLSGIARPFTRHDIDAVVADRPVVLDSYCGHACMLNTKALELAGVTKDTPNPEAGIIRREADGTPDGYIQEPVIIAPICSRIPDFEFTPDQVRQGILEAQKVFAGMGYTYVADCMANDISYSTLLDMAKKGELIMRVDGVYNCNDATREADLESAIARRGMYDVDDILKVDTVKYFVDGNLAMCEPYEEAFRKANGLPDTFGTTDALLWNVENLKESMEKVQKAGFNIHVHAMGDFGAKCTVDCVENAQKQDPEHKRRNILAHCSFVREEDKKRMGKLGIVASIQPEWEAENEISEPGFTKLFGSERHKTIYPNKSMVDAGVICAYGSDFAVSMPNALSGIQTAMTRCITKANVEYEKLKDVPAMNPAECVSLKEAIKGHTIHVAYQFHREALTGSIQVGKSAEMVVLDKDIEKQPVREIADLKITETLFKGNTTFKA